MPRPIYLTHNGITDTISGWAKRIGVPKDRVAKRIQRGVALSVALNADKLGASEGKALSTDGYYVNGRCAKLHRIKAEQILGRKLKPDESVHHIDGNKLNNDNNNLLICKQDYHSLIHQRMRAMSACGNPDWRICKFCGEYDNPENLYIHPTRTEALHHSCRRSYEANRRAK